MRSRSTSAGGSSRSKEISGFFLEGVARHSGGFGPAAVLIGVLVV
jgi:hypothetical protein